MACFVTTIDLSLSNKLKLALENQGFALTTPPYTLFSGKKKGVSCTLYSSGKLTVQGKDKDAFITNFLEPEILGTFDFSYPHLNQDKKPHIGVDEAGKGDFFGPLVIASLYADTAGIERLIKLGVKDSKTLNDKTICALASKIKQEFKYSVLILNPAKYNELYDKFQNLNRMLAWGHATMIDDLVKKTGCKDVLIDQFANEKVVEYAVNRKGLAINLTQKHRGEEDLVVAGASILARAAFVDSMDRLSKTYNFDIPKGASNKVILAGKKLVAKFGPEILGDTAKAHFKTRSDVLS